MISMIAVLDVRGALGYRGHLLWSLPDDWAHFLSSIRGKTIVMGRTTAQGLEGALPDCRNLVLSTHGKAPYPGQEVVPSLSAVLEFRDAWPAEEIVICGGARVYREFLPYADRLILTHVDDQVAHADAVFPIEVLQSPDWTDKGVLLDHASDEPLPMNAMRTPFGFTSTCVVVESLVRGGLHPARRCSTLAVRVSRMASDPGRIAQR